MRTCVVIPAKNEAATIGATVGATLNHVDRVVVANDTSGDDTASLARAAGASVVDVPTSRQGLAGVYVCGLAWALANTDADCIVEMDAGGSHDPTELPKLLEAVSGGADLAAGMRFGPGGAHLAPRRRVALSRFGTALVNAVHGTRWHDGTSGFIAYKRAALAALLSKPYRSRGHFYQSEVRLRARALGLALTEVPIQYRSSSSSLNTKSIVEALRLCLTVRQW